MKDKHLIVVSVDAMVYEDLALLSTLPHVGKLMAEGALVKKVTTIYPSLTHPIHTTLMTGCAAGRTGVTANEHLMPGEAHPVWYNYLDEVRCDTLFHAARRAGLTTCSCRWPLTAGGFDTIDYLVPEVMATDEIAEPDVEKLYRKMASPILMDDIILPNLPLLKGGHKHPDDENFAMACACDIIRKYKPNLVMTHPSVVDAARHANGLFNEPVNDALRLIDGWVGDLMRAVEDAGIADTTDFAIISDHGHLEVQRTMALNVFLRDRGFITTREDGSLADWTAFAKACGLSMQIYVKDESRKGEVYDALKEMREEGIYGISEVFTAEEARSRYGLWGDFSFVVETDGYTAFCEDWRRPAVRPAANIDYHHGRSTHGHMPEKGPQPPMILCGASFRKGAVLERGSVLDEAPTFAAVLGVELRDADGKPMTELLAR